MQKCPTDILTLSRLQRLIVLVFTLVVFSILLIHAHMQGIEWKNPPSLFGACDFVAFWAGFHVWQTGGNPYDLAAVFRLEQLAIPGFKEPLAYLNPPWALILLAPFLAPDFELARFLWIGWNLFFFIASTALICQWFELDRKNTMRAVALSFLFVPVLMNFWLGQLSLLITFFLVASFTAILRGRDLLAGALLVPLTIKPHILLLIAAALFFWILTKKRWAILLGFVSGLFFVFLVLLAVSPPLFAAWQQMEFSPFVWRTSSVATLIRERLFTGANIPPVWPAYLLTSAAIVATSIWFFTRRREIDWRLDLPSLAALSLAFAPYVWLHDYSLLVIVQSCLFAQVLKLPPRALAYWRILFILVGAQIMLVLCAALTNNLQWFFWFPFIMWLIWQKGLKLLEQGSITA